MKATVFSLHYKTRRRESVLCMKRKQVVGLCFVVIFTSLLFTSTYSRESYNRRSSERIKIQAHHVPSYENHSRITILTSDGFTTWPGSGTIDDPYVIEGLQIIDFQFSLSNFFFIKSYRYIKIII